LTAGLVIACAAPALAQQDPVPATTAENQTDADKIAVGAILGDLISPESPAFSMLGVSANEVTHPETPKKLALGVLNGLDPNGNFQTGFAVQFSPVLLFGGNQITYTQYRTNRATRALARLEVVSAVTKGTGDDKAARATLGLVWTPIQLADPYASDELHGCISGAFDKVPLVQPGDTPEETQRNLEAKAAQLGPLVAACRKRHAVSPADDMLLQVGAAPIFLSTSGETDDFRAHGFVANGIFRIGMRRLFGMKPSQNGEGPHGQVILAAAYRNNEVVPDPANEGQFLERDRLNAGGRILFGSLDSPIFGLEALYQRASYSNAGKDRYVTYAASFDYPLREGLWIGLSAGGSSGKRVGGDEGFVGLRLRFGAGDKPSVNDLVRQ
jgi:hypothetical protein